MTDATNTKAPPEKLAPLQAQKKAAEQALANAKANAETQVRLLTAGNDNTARSWEVGKWDSSILFTETQPILGAAHNPDKIQFFVAVQGPDSWGLRLRRMDNRRSTRAYGLGTAKPLNVIGPTKAFQMYVPCTDNTVRVYDIRNMRLLATLVGHED